MSHDAASKASHQPARVIEHANTASDDTTKSIPLMPRAHEDGRIAHNAHRGPGPYHARSCGEAVSNALAMTRRDVTSTA